MPFPPRHGMRVMALCPPRTGLGFLGIQEKAVALAVSVLNIVGMVTPRLTGTYALTGSPQTQEMEESVAQTAFFAFWFMWIAFGLCSDDALNRYVP